MKVGILFEAVDIIENNTMKLNSTQILSVPNHIKKALELNGYQTIMINGVSKLVYLLDGKNINFDCIFNLADGTEPGDWESYVPSILRAHNIPYTGSDTSTLAIAQNKFATKRLAEFLDINTPKYEFVSKNDTVDYQKITSRLNFPMVVKVNNKSCSIGLKKVENESELKKFIISLRQKFSFDILCEEYISGLEIAVPILGTGECSRTLGIVSYSDENKSDITDIFTIEQKYFDEFNYKFADISELISNELKSSALKLHKILDCKGYSRVDFRLSESGIPYLLEINPLPDLTKEGTFAFCGKRNNLSFEEIVNHILLDTPK